MTNRRMMLIAALASLAAPLYPQTMPQPILVQVARVNVKPDRVQEWLEIEKQYSEAYKKGGGTFRYVYRNNAGNPYEYMVTTGVGKYANLDEKTPYAKGTTEGELARLAARRHQCVDSALAVTKKLG